MMKLIKSSRICENIDNECLFKYEIIGRSFEGRFLRVNVQIEVVYYNSGQKKTFSKVFSIPDEENLQYEVSKYCRKKFIAK